MAQEYVEAGLEFVEAVNRGDIDAALQLVHAEVTFEPLRAATEGAFVGREGLTRFLLDTAETFEFFRLDYTDIRDLGDSVLAIGTIRIRGRESGVETDVPSAAIAQYKDGLLWRYKDFGDARLALEAAGLTE